MLNNVSKKLVQLVAVLILLTSCHVQEVYEQQTSTPIPIFPTETQAPTSTPTAFPTPTVPTQTSRGIFEPPDGKVLLFVGQDNASIGGNDPYHDGYVDHVGLPAGVTGYVYMVEGWTNRFGYTYDVGSIDGLNQETTWGAGPVCMKCILDSPTFKHTIVHLSISMVDGSEAKIADGTYDYLIETLTQFLMDYQDHPFFLRIGYEFDGVRNAYNPENYKKAFRRIVDQLRAAGLKNFVTVMSSTSVSVGAATWDQYYPGDDYVDWIGYSYWGESSDSTGTLDFARAHGKPVFIAESAPAKYYLGVADGNKVWREWFEPYFRHIQENLDVTKAVSYIDCHWEAQPMWIGRNWGDTRIEANPVIHYKWNAMMYDPMFITGNDDVFQLIGFNSKQE